MNSGFERRIGCVILASGQSVRYSGSNKLMAPCDGQPLYTWALEAIPEEAFCEIVVVTAHEEIQRDAERRGVRVIMNGHPEEGIASSVRLGTAEMEEMDGCMYCVADQPYMSPASLRRLVKGFTGGIRALSLDNERGNPAIFGRAYYPELLALRGDRGGGAVIKEHPDGVQLVPAECALELMDVDSPEDMRKLEGVKNLLFTGPDRETCLVFLTQAIKAEKVCSPGIVFTEERAPAQLIHALDGRTPVIGVLPGSPETGKQIRRRTDTRIVYIDECFPADAWSALDRFSGA